MVDGLVFVLRALAFVLGVLIVAGTFASAVQTFVVPRSARTAITRIVFRNMRRLYGLRLRKVNTYDARDRIMASYAPFSLLMLPVVWLICVLLGYMFIFWAFGVDSLYDDFKLSGSSLLTLGFSTVEDLPKTIIAFSEAAMGLILVALLISYLPTIYGAFSRREAAVTNLEVRAGSPPSAIELISRYHRLGRLGDLDELWSQWEGWFIDIEETHTSLAALNFFRSPQAHRSWVTAAGTVLDAAALIATTVAVPHQARADLCLRAGYISLRHIADFFLIDYDPNPRPGDPISIARVEFNEAYDTLASRGVPLKPDRDDCWRHFAGWRVNYDSVLLALAALTMAPEAPWSSDRSLLRTRRKAPLSAKLPVLRRRRSLTGS